MEMSIDNNALAKEILAKVLVADSKNTEIRKLDMTQNQKLILRHLLVSEKNGNELSMTELSHLLDITKSAASQTVAKLERKGIVKRRWAKGDRRKIVVNLTSKGSDMAAIFYSEIIKFIQEMLDKLDEDEKQLLIKIFDKCTK